MWSVIACALRRVIAPCELSAVLVLEHGNVFYGEPDWHFDGHCHAVVAEHEALQRFVPQLVGYPHRE